MRLYRIVIWCYTLKSTSLEVKLTKDKDNGDDEIVLEQLRAIDQIYDLLALCSSYIFNKIEIDEDPYEFAIFRDDDYENIYDAIEKYCNDKQQIGSGDALDELIEYLINFMTPEVTIEKCYAVVKYIDELVEVEIDSTLLGNKHFIKYATLNNRYTEQVRIIPKLKGTLTEKSDLQFKDVNDNLYSSLRKKRECACSLLDKEVTNYMIWDKVHIDAFPLSIYRFDERSPIFKHFYNREEIVFGIVPFTNESIDDILEIRYQERAFFVERMYEKAENNLKRKYLDVINRCEGKDIDFLIFPEMLMTDAMISSAENVSKSTRPQIIVNGSIWEDYANKSVITDGHGRKIADYYKKEPFEFEKDGIEYKEYLKRDQNKEYIILEIDGIGRIGIGICKDLINEKFKLFHKFIKTDILIVPAYTKSMDLQSSAEGLTQEYNCTVVVANACSALDSRAVNNDKKRIGFITVPAKVNTDRFRIIKMYEQNECNRECTQKCVGRMLSIDFSRMEHRENILSYKIKEATF